MAAVSAPRGANKPGVGATEKVSVGKQPSCAQRIESATVKRTQVNITETQSLDADALFRVYDSEDTQLLSRGATTELLKQIGLKDKLGEAFSASAQLAFDAHSADSHFLSLPEFRQLYYLISKCHPDLLPRAKPLSITVIGAKGLPPADMNGKSDPYCTICVKNSTRTKPHSLSKTRVIAKTLEPKWDEEFCDKYSYEEGDSLKFEIFDYDPGSKPDLLAWAELPSEEFHRAGGFHGTWPMNAEKGYQPGLKLRVVVNGIEPEEPNLRVLIKYAKDLPPADTNGKSDPFCAFQIAGKPYTKSQTKIQKKTLDPVWDEEFNDKYRYVEGDNLQFSVYDYDANGKYDLLGKAVLESSKFHRPEGFDGPVDLTEVCAKGYHPKLFLKIVVREFEDMAAAAAAAAASAAAAAASAAPAPAAE